MLNLKSSLNERVFNIAQTLLKSYTPDKENLEIEQKKEQFLNDNPNAIIAIYPCIIDQAFALTMDKYRKYIANYNFTTEQENSEINKWNSTVDEITEISETAQIFKALFLKNNAHLPDREFNNKVDEFFEDKEIMVKKRKIASVKYATELIFQAFIAAYNAQLINHNTAMMQLNVAIAKPIQPIKINSWFITRMKRNGIQSLDLCTRTVRNHRDRLLEAGVLIDRQYKGSRAAVEFHINPEILTVLDFKTNKIATPDNQTVTPTQGKKLPDNDVTTRSLLNENKRNENGLTDFQVNTSSGKALTVSYFGTRPPDSNEEKKTTPPAGKMLNFSDNLLKTLEDEQTLSEKLANREYLDYKPIDIRYLITESSEGTLSNEEFFQVVIQDFFKASNKLWKNHDTVYVGSWRKALNFYLKNKFRLFNGKVFQKANLVDHVQELRWRLEFARKWFLKNDNVKILFPSDYFDISRVKTYEIGFEATKEFYNNHLKQVEKTEISKAKAKAKAKRRAAAYKYNAVINKFLNNKMTWDQLKNYVDKNLPKEFQKNLSVDVHKRLLEKEKLEQEQAYKNISNKVNYNLYEL